ncbi:beta strand repeat-containing protein [Opitutus terrae]|uniref:Autotransporter-associated beta strand repeat protein n=1 Tax=Opitutus terrae (strain DSM 11246 / JCM 15787 / PB90-1) TaxID=452637 RepID=B1ZVE4_OPITP|nr:autotransporter-associated beta strand repeat-containing protein [Opitutus terrae]ACB76811.1 autotransporter-associated beta strand repeat protein [Opitutus terrae PB90-1]
MKVHREPLVHRRLLRGWIAAFAAFFLAVQARGQLVVVNETFKDTTFAAGASWVVGGTNYTPNLTAASGVDSPGNGWLRLTSAGGQQATYAYDSQSFNGADATIAVKFSYAAYGGSGADGITFFLADASKTFSVGAYGGSLGYAQKTLVAGGEADIQGMNGGYIGLGIDEFGNYSNATEGRIGGIGSNPGNVSVRGPGSSYSGYDYLGGTGSLSTPIAFSGASRPTGDNARIFQVVITATNQLTVFMQAGETAPMEALYSIDLSGYARPEDLILGFTGSTGGSTNIHEIQGLSLTSLKADLWTNSGGTSTWANGSNWDGTDGNIPEVGADILLNNRYVSTPQTIDVGGTRSIRSLQIDAPFAYTLNNGAIEFNDQGVLGPSGIFVSKGNGSANHTVNSALVARNAITITNSSTGTLQLNGTLATDGNAVTLSGTGNTALAGVVSGGGSITKLGAGNATLSGNNTYSGGTTLQAGTLTAGHNNAFGTGDITIKGGTLASSAGNVVANAVVLKGNAGVSNITTSGTLTQTGGNYTLSMANATQSGVVNLSNNTTSRSLTVAVGSGTSTISGVIQDGGGSTAGNLTKTGSGTLVLGGANTYTGTTSIDAGTLQLGANDRLADTSSVSIAASGTLNLNGYSDKVGSLTAIGGATLNFGSPTGANTFVFGNYTAPASGVLVVNNWQQGVDTLATSVGGQNVSSVYFSGFGVAQVAGARSDNMYGTGANGAYLLTPAAASYKEWDGSSSTAWTNNNNWTSAGAPNSTQVALFDALGVGRTTASLANNSTTIAGIKFGSGASVSYTLTSNANRTLTLSGAVPYIQQQSSKNQTISVGTLALGANSVADITGAGNLAITSVISGTNRALIKDGNGAGKLILSGNNTFSGGLYVNNGVAQANSNTALGTGTATVSPGATLEVSGSRTIANALSLSGAGVGGNGALRSVAGANTFSGTITETGDTTIVADTGTTLSLTGNITGTAVDTTFGGAGSFTVNRITTDTGGVTLAGTGTLTMAGTTNANTYTGATTVNSGTLVLSKTAGTTAVAGNLIIGDGAGAGSSAVVRLGAANQIADTSAVVLGSDGLLNLNGSSETIASLAGSGVIDNASTTATTLTFGDTGSTTFSGLIQDSGTGNLSLVKQGSGKITLTGANTYAGTTSLASGIIAIQHNTALGSGAATISSGANLEVAGGLTVTNAIALNGPGTLANDGAIQSTAGNNTLSGNLTLQSASRLVADASSSLTLTGAALTSTAGSAQNLSFGGAGDITVNKVIGSATAANNVGTLTKDGDGTLVLTAANLFSGATTINAGTLELRSNAGLGATATGTAVANGATLALANNITSAESQIAISGAGVGGAGALRNLSGTNTLSGAIALNAAATIGVDAGSLTASGVVSGANSLTKVGAGSLTLSGTAANTFSGGVTVNEGTLALAKTANVSAVGSGNVTIGDATGAANSAVVQLTNANQIGATANVTINSDGQLNLNSKNETIGSLAGSGSVTLGSTANLLTVGNTTSTVFTGSVTTTGTGAVTKTGTGTLQIGGISGSNSFAAATLNLNQGTVQLGASNILGTALNFNGGTFSVNGFDETVSSATLTSSSILDFNSLAGVFDLSSGIYIGGTLTINGWAGSISGGGASQLLLGGTITGALLGNINFTGYGSGAQIVNGEIVPITGTVYTWKAAGGGNWVADANWNPDPPLTGVGPTGAGVSVVFGNALTADSTVALTAGKTVGYMTFNDDNRYTISGSTVTMDVNSGSAQINVSNSGGGTIASTLALSDALQIAQNSSSQFIISGNITGTARNLTVGGSGDTLISGNIATTTGTLTKNNAGTLTLSGTNTFTGATTVNAGVLAISSETNLGNNPAALSAAQLTLNGGTLRTITNAVTLDDANRGVTIGASGGTFDTVSNLTIGGTGAATNVLAINGTLTKTGSGTLTFAGTGANTGNGAVNVDAGTLAITKSANVSALGDTAAVTIGSGATLQFNGTSTYTAETIGSLAGGGTVTNASAGAFALTAGGAGTSTTFSGALQNTGGALSLTKTGAGTLTLTDTAGASNFTGATTVNAGALNIRAGTALGSTTGGTTVASGAALELQGGISVGTEALSLTGTGVGANGALRNISGNNSFAGAITLGGATEIQSDSGTLTLSGGIGGAQNLTLAGVGNTTVSGAITTGAGTLTKADSGYAVLSGVNTFTGATSITGGTLEIRSNAALGTTAGATTVSAGGTLALSSGISTAEGLTINGVGSSSAGALRSLSGNNTVSGTVALGSSSLVGVDADTLTVSGVVSGGGSLTKVGAGTLALNATNTYTGGTAINAGIVQIAADRGLGALPGTATPGNVTLNGGTLATTFTGALTTNRGVALGAAGGTISPSAGTTLTYGGIVAGTGALTKSGDGTLTLTGANTYSGGTALTGGTLSINSDARLGAVPGTPNANHLTFAGGTLATTASMTLNPNRGVQVSGAGGKISVANGTTLSFGGTITGPGELELALGGSGVFALTNDINWTGGTLALGGGTFRLAGYDLSVGTLRITGDTILDFGSGLASILTTANVIIQEGATLTITNWVNGTDQFIATNSLASSNGTQAQRGATGVAPQNQIVFTGFGGNSSRWSSYDNQITPVPEPSTYGLILLGGCLGLFAWRRWKKQPAARA